MRLMRGFALQLAIAVPAPRIEAAFVDGRPHGAAGLQLMGAVPEAAASRQRLDVGEHRRDAGLRLPQAELAHARRVEDEPALRQEDQFAMRRGVAAARVMRADLLRRHHILAGKRVHEGRFADARRAEQHGRQAGPEHGAQGVEPLARQSRHGAKLRADGDALDLGEERSRVRAGIELRQHDDGLRAAFPGGREVALEPPRAEICVERGEKQRHIDIRRDDLRGRHGLDRLAAEGGEARQDVVDGRHPFLDARGGRHPVAGDRMARHRPPHGRSVRIPPRRARPPA